MSDPSRSSALTALRAAAAVAALALSALVLHMVRRELAVPDAGSFVLTAIICAPVAAGALACAWFALRGHVEESRAQMRAGCATGLVVGGIGFAGGFVGPLILTPGSNQGPLLGILVTGPLGFVAGALVGVAVRRARRKRP